VDPKPTEASNAMPGDTPAAPVGQPSQRADLRAELTELRETVAKLQNQFNAPHRLAILVNVFAVLVGIASMCVVAYVGYQARAVSEANLKVSEENLKWLRETHDRDLATNLRMKKHDAADRFFIRFYEIEKDKDRKQISDDFYYQQIYGLHFDEFNHYANGFLEKELYETWPRFRWKAYHQGVRA
jgi:hypothetical protein